MLIMFTMHEPTHQGHSTPTPSLTEDAIFFLLLTNVSFHFITKTKADSSKTGGHSRLFIIQTVENGAFVLDSFNPSAIPAYSSWVE